MALLPRLTARRGRMIPLLVTCAWGVVVVAVLSGVDTGGWFIAACAALGLTIGGTWVLPGEMAVDVVPDPEQALVTYRITADLGLAVGGPLYGGLVSLGGTRLALGGAAVQLLAMAVIAVVAGETDPARQRDRSPQGRRHLSPVPAPSSGGDMPDSSPTPMPVAAVLADQGRDLSPALRERALASHRAARPAIERLRAVPMSFYEAVDEPGEALAWLERGRAS
jgi:MFS family permease